MGHRIEHEMGKAVEDLKEAGQYPEGDVIRILLEQHARIRTLLTGITMAADDEVADLFAEFRALLAVHETAEQLVVRPVTARVAGEDLAQARTREEAEVTQLLATLEDLDPTSPEFMPRMAEVQQMVTRHAESEERVEFPALLDGCSAAERLKMGRALAAVERVAPTRTHPDADHSAAGLLRMPIAALIDRAKDALDSVRSEFRG